jgi:hypothetical protein
LDGKSHDQSQYDNDNTEKNGQGCDPSFHATLLTFLPFKTHPNTLSVRSILRTTGKSLPL